MMDTLAQTLVEDPPSLPALANKIYGPFLIGVCLQCILYGVTCVQGYTYFSTSARDRKWVRMFITYIMLVETLATALNIALIYDPLILGYGSTANFVTSPFWIRPDGVLTALIAVPVQMFMAWRIYVLTRSFIIPCIICFLSVVALGGGIALTVMVSLRPHFVQFATFKPAPAIWLGSAAVSDIIITATLAYVLIKKKSGFRATDNYIDRLILVTIQTGSFTAIGAAADIIVFLSVEGTTVYFIWNLSLSKLYTTSILSSLNTRTKAVNVLFHSESSRHTGHSRSQGGTSSVPGDIELNLKNSTYPSAPIELRDAKADGFSEPHYNHTYAGGVRGVRVTHEVMAV